MIVTGGGILPSMNRDVLIDNLETSFVSNIDQVPWHKKYTGLIGYVISNNPLTSQKPKFYPFSAQIGNVYSEKVQVYAQEAEVYGLKRTILLWDTNKNISFWNFSTWSSGGTIMEKCFKVAALYVATLKALALIHQHNHWTTKGEMFYGDHLLFERLYNSTLENLDLAAEKFIGVFSDECLNYDLQTELLHKVLLKYKI